MVRVREAEERDVAGIRDVFLATYGEDYAYPQYYDPYLLKKMVFSDDTLLLVAEEEDSGRVLGTASVVLQIGAFADLVGEFGRLAVDPVARGQGIGHLLMENRIARVADRLHVGLVEPKVNHLFSQKITFGHGFKPLGLLPLNLRFGTSRESAGLCVRYFGDALQLRRNHPRVLPETAVLAELVMGELDIDCDVIVDGDAAPYPYDEDFEIEELASNGYASLLRCERGRVRHREVFGPVRLHYGMFKLQASHAHYLLAREKGRIVGAVGFIIDEIEYAVRIFELISVTDRPLRFLLQQVLDRCRDRWNTAYVEVDVNADSPRMQRSLFELGFLPVAYVPAMVFHEVERLDVVRMVRLLVPPHFDDVVCEPVLEPVISLVTSSFATAYAAPQLRRNMERVGLLQGMTKEQVDQLAAISSIETFAPNQVIVREGEQDEKMRVLLQGHALVSLNGAGDRPVAEIGAGSCIGEMSLLTTAPHSATVVAQDHLETVVFSHTVLESLMRRRPDIGLQIYRNLATGLGEKLRHADAGL